MNLYLYAMSISSSANPCTADRHGAGQHGLGGILNPQAPLRSGIRSH